MAPWMGYKNEKESEKAKSKTPPEFERKWCSNFSYHFLQG
jgi:hypothetical protein